MEKYDRRLEVLQDPAEKAKDHDLLAISIAGFTTEQQFMAVAIQIGGALEVRTMLFEQRLRDCISATRKESVFVPMIFHTQPSNVQL